MKFSILCTALDPRLSFYVLLAAHMLPMREGRSFNEEIKQTH